MPAFTILSVFEAIDRISAPFRGMGRSVETFASRTEIGIARAERAFRKLTPALSASAKQLLAFATTATITAGIISTIHFSTRSIKEYEVAVQSFRTIVSDATDQEFAAYQKAINSVAKATKKSSIDVAASFEKIAGLNEKFAETSEGIALVSKASVTLSKASGDELGPSAESLVGIMNQFDFAANQANRTINVLAAGAGVGAASIIQTSESFKNFGSVAKGANIPLEQSVGLIQTLGKFSVFGAEAGTKLRGSVLKLQQAGIGYASGQFNINDALTEAAAKVNKLGTEQLKDAAILKMFGAENISTGKILLENISIFKEFTKGVTGTNAAAEQAEIRSNTLTNRLEELKNAWTNIINDSNKAGSALNSVKNVVIFLADNLATIVSVGSKIILFFAAWKALLIVSNVAIGIMGALTGVASIAIGKSSIALAAYKTVLAIGTAAQWLWNAALSANPIGLVIIAIIALIALIVVIIRKYNEWGAALAFVLGPLGLIINLIQSFRRHWDMIVEAFTAKGILGGIKAIGIAIFDAILMPVEQLLGLVSRLSGWEWAENATKGIGILRNKLEQVGLNISAGPPAASEVPATPAPLLNPERSRQDALREIVQTNNAKVVLDINDPDNRVKAKSSDPEMVEIKVGSTWAQAF